MRMPRLAPRLVSLGLLVAALALGGCNEIIPKFELRDDYMGKRFIQPGKVTGEVERDAYGNPVLPKQPDAPRS